MPGSSPKRRPAGRSPTPRCRAISPAWARRGSASTRTTPPRLFARKLWLVAHRTELPLNYSYAYYERDEQTVLRWLPIGAWCLVPLGVAGLAARPRAGVARAGYLAWAALVPLYAISVAVFFVAGRYRLPMLVPLAIAGAGGITSTVAALRTRRWMDVAILLAAFGMAATATLWPLALDDGRLEERVAMASALAGLGRPADAMAQGRRDRARAPRARHRALSRRAGAAGTRRSGLRRSRGAPGAVDRSEAAGSACRPRPAARARRPRRRGTPSHAACGGRWRQRHGCRAVDRRRRDRWARDVERGVRGGGGSADGGGGRRHAARHRPASARGASRRSGRALLPRPRRAVSAPCRRRRGARRRAARARRDRRGRRGRSSAP